MRETDTCIICGKPYYFGNNAAPVANGFCCDHCHLEVVIPARMAQLKKPRQKQ
jgi:hypothetical protein